MMSQGLPQGLPMPMGDDMVAVQEEVVGRMPPVEGMQRGGVVSIPAGKKSLPFDPNDPLVQHFALGGTPSFDESMQERIAARQKYFGTPPVPEKRSGFELALETFGPAVAALLTPKEQGGGIRGATAALSQSAGGVLERQRAEKIAQDNREFAQQQAIAQGAFSSEEAAMTAENLAQSKIAAAIAGRTSPNTTTTQFERMLAQGVANGTYTEEQATEMKDAFLKNALIPQPTREQIEAARQKTNLETERLKNFRDEQNRYGNINLENAADLSKAVQERVDISQLTGLIAGLKDLAKSGPGREATVKLGELVTAGSRILGLQQDEVRGLLSAIPGLNLTEDLALADVERALGNQVTLMYTSNFPGNLNQSEVDISANSAYAGLAGTQKGARILDMLMKKKTSRAQERQRLYLKTRKDHYAAAAGMDRAASERELFDKWNEASAAYTKSYQDDTSIMDYIRANVSEYAPGGVLLNRTPALLAEGITPEQQNEMLSNVVRAPAFINKARSLVKIDANGQLVSESSPAVVQESRKRMVNALLNRVIPQILDSSQYKSDNIEKMAEGYISLSPENQAIVRNFVLRKDNLRSVQDSIGAGWKNVIEQFFGLQD